MVCVCICVCVLGRDPSFLSPKEWMTMSLFCLSPWHEGPVCIIYPWNSDEPLLGPNHVSSKGRPQGLETWVGRKWIFLLELETGRFTTH